MLVVVERHDELTWKSLRNVAEVHLIAPGQLNTYDVLVSDDVVFTEGALAAFLAGPPKGKGARPWHVSRSSTTGRRRTELQGPQAGCRGKGRQGREAGQTEGSVVSETRPACGRRSLRRGDGGRGRGRTSSDLEAEPASRLRPRAPAATLRPPDRMESAMIPDPRDVILSPGHLGEELRAGRRRHLHLHRPPGRQQDPDQDRRRADLRGEGRPGQHANRKGKRKRTRSGFGQRKATKRALSAFAPATPSTSSAVPRPNGRQRTATPRSTEDETTWVSVSTSRRRRGAAAPAWPTSSRSPAVSQRSRWSARCTARAAVTLTVGSPRVTRAVATSGPTASSTSVAHDKDGVPAKVAHIEYDPNRTARIALLHYADGEKRYIIAPTRLKQGDTVVSGPASDIRPGNACRCATSRPAPWSTHRAEAGRRREDRPQRRRQRAVGGQGRPLRPAAYALR